MVHDTKRYFHGSMINHNRTETPFNLEIYRADNISRITILTHAGSNSTSPSTPSGASSLSVPAICIIIAIGIGVMISVGFCCFRRSEAKSKIHATLNRALQDQR